MTSQLETELRATLQRRADQVPAEASARLAARDYHPRVRRRRRPAAVGLLAGAAGTAGAVVSLVGGASNAFAGWTPTPTPPSPTQLASAGASCRSQSPIAGLPLQLTDTRGPFTFEVYADQRASAVCISGPKMISVSGSSSSADVQVPADQLLLSSSHMTNRDGQAYSFADGRAGAGVTAATLVLDDGTQVKATVGNGWYVAWWPSGHEVARAELTTASGARTQTFDLRHQSPCGANACTGGAVGSGSGATVSRAGAVSGAGAISGGRSGGSVSGAGTSTGTSTSQGG